MEKLNAQRDQRFSNDVKGETWYGPGAVFAELAISNLYEMLVDGAVFLPTPHEERSVYTTGGAFWIRYGAPYSDLFIEGQVSYLSNIKVKNPLEGGHFYIKNDRGLEYSILFDYDYVSFGFLPGWFLPLPNRDRAAFGVYVTAGFVWTIASGRSIDYWSNEPQFDLGVEKTLEQGFKFRNDFAGLCGLGLQYKHNDDWAIDLRYTQGWGLVDILETQANPYFWTEQDNRTRIKHQLGLTFLIRYGN